MDDKKFREQYKKEFDRICASDKLRNAVKDVKPQKPRRVVTPFKATIGTVAAAIMIFAAVHEYSFEPDTSGVISEKVVSTQLPDSEFRVVEITGGSSETQVPEENAESVETANTVFESSTQSSSAPKAESKAKSAPNSTKAPQKPAPAKSPTVARNTNADNLETPTQAPIDTESPVSTQTTEFTENSVGEPVAASEGIMPFSSGGSPSRMIEETEAYMPPAVQMWTVEQYYEYLDTNISQKIPGSYTGAQLLEFEVGSNGIPLDDTAVLSFTLNNGGNLRITVSKHILFDTSLSGTVIESGSGYNAYKVSGGVYYNLYATDTTEEAVRAVVNSL